MSIGRWTYLGITIILAAQLLSGSSIPADDQIAAIRYFTRDIEFDYVTWTLSALKIKLNQYAIGVVDYIPEKMQRQLALEYIELVAQIQFQEAMLRNIYTDPNISDPQAESTTLLEELDRLYKRRDLIAPLAESILQDQLSDVVAEFGLSIGGQAVPPILYHSTPLPNALIVSPRNTIRQDANISLIPDLTLDQQVELEDDVDDNLNVSSLVVNIGGIGVYPTMVMQTSDINWLTEVVAHEWIHNFLTLRPLGMSYMVSPELRTMNETAAAIAGKELGLSWIGKFYPELLPPPPPESPSPSSSEETEPPEFDFNAEMRQTREMVDQLLAEGKIEEAEKYMEERRIFLWENGYYIRKLNQAYFAFHGAYGDVPGGPAGEDPVGEAVRALRKKSPSLATFLNRISWMYSFQQLQDAVGEEIF